MKSRLREAIVIEVLSAVDNECRLLCRKHQSCLQQTGITDLQDISFHEIIEEWQQLAPLFLSILQTVLKVVKKTTDKSETLTGFLGSALLYGRSQRMSRVPYMLGLTLDGGGATNEVSETLLAYMLYCLYNTLSWSTVLWVICIIKTLLGIYCSTLN